VVQFSALGSSPGGALPILSRWRRILRTSGGSVMSAMSFISEPHRGQSIGSTSYAFAISLAQADRQAACGTVGSGCAGTGSMWDWRHPRGAARRMWGHACQRTLHREEYNP